MKMSLVIQINKKFLCFPKLNWPSPCASNEDSILVSDPFNLFNLQTFIDLLVLVQPLRMKD